MAENLGRAFVFFIIASALMMLVKTLALFSDLSIISSFVYDSFMAFPSLFFLLGIINFYKSIVKEIRPAVHRVHHRSVRRRR